jgi:hypothetical protein
LAKLTGSIDYIFSGRESWNCSILWYCITDIVSDYDRDLLRNEPVALYNNRDDLLFIDIGRYVAFRFVFSMKAETENFIELLTIFDINIDENDIKVVDTVQEESFWSRINRTTNSEEQTSSKILLVYVNNNDLIHWALKMLFKL